MKGLILDASMAMEWFAHDASDEALEKRTLLDDHAVLVPQLWQYEVTSVITRWRRQGRITEADATHALLELGRLPLATIDQVDLHAISALALAHDLSAYDATYLHVAMISGEPLATLDRQLQKAAAAVGVTCL